MMYLVDANVLSEPTKPAPDPRVVEWLTSHEGQVVVDAVVLGELSVGVLAYPAGRKRAALEAWFESVVQVIDCLPWDAGVSLRWARLVAQLKRKGQSLPLLDSMIAATALYHGLTVVTHNTRDFQRAGVKVFDPFLG
jgi:predicted nucleic acid-binding protein